MLDTFFLCKLVVIASNFQTRFVSPLLLVLATFTLITSYCVNLANCSAENYQNINQKRHLNKLPRDEQELFDELYDISEEEGRTFSISNVSLAITYITFITALVMLGGFIWLAISAGGASGSSNSYGSSYGSYNRRIFSEGVTDWLFSGGNFFGYDSGNNRHKRSSKSNLRDEGMICKYYSYKFV